MQVAQSWLNRLYQKLEFQTLKDTTSTPFLSRPAFTRAKTNNITTKLYDKRDAFGFYIVNFPFMSSNIPSAPAYRVYASQLIRYGHCCSNLSDFYHATGPLRQDFCCRVTELIVCPTHLRNSMADTLIALDNTRKMSFKCLLILSVKMIFIFYGFANGRIEKMS